MTLSIQNFSKMFPWVLAALLSLLGLTSIFYGIYLLQMQRSSEEFTSQVCLSNPKQEFIVVDVSGAVERPGLYSVPRSSRIGDAIAAAGGFAKDANPLFVAHQLNGAAALSDEQKIYIPTTEEAQEERLKGGETSISSSGVTGISINSASIDMLQELPGIGEKRAKDIVDNRPYASVSELIEKAGLPSSTVTELEEFIHF